MFALGQKKCLWIICFYTPFLLIVMEKLKAKLESLSYPILILGSNMPMVTLHPRFALTLSSPKNSGRTRCPFGSGLGHSMTFDLSLGIETKP